MRETPRNPGWLPVLESLLRSMESLNRIITHGATLLRSSARSARIAILGLVAIAAGSLIWWSTRPEGSQTEPLLGDVRFSAREIEAMEAAFARHTLTGSEVTGDRILVPQGRKHEFLAVLAKEQSLPQQLKPEQRLLEGNIFEPRETRHERRRIADQTKLASLIEKMDGIASADVQFDEHIPHGLARRTERRAIALVRGLQDQPLTGDQIRAIRDTVTGYVAGLEPTDVTVTDLAAMRAYPGGATPSPNPYAETKQLFEHAWQKKIQERLSRYTGVVVAVNVELHSTRAVDPPLATEKGPSPPESVSLNQREPVSLNQRASVGVTASAERLQPQLAIGSQTVGNAPRAIENYRPGQANGEKAAGAALTELQADNAAAGQQTPCGSSAPMYADCNQLHAAMQPQPPLPPLVPQRVTVSIDFPYRYVERLHRLHTESADSSQQRTLDEVEKHTRDTIQQAVARLLPTGTQESAEELVSVTVYREMDERAMTPLLGGDSTTRLRNVWLGPLGAGAFFLVLWIWRKRARSFADHKQGSRESDIETPDAPLRPMEFSAAAGQPGPENAPAGESPDLRRQASQIIRQDPNAAANVLRHWMRDVA